MELTLSPQLSTSLFFPYPILHPRLQLMSIQRGGMLLGHSKILDKVGFGSEVLHIHVSF